MNKVSFGWASWIGVISAIAAAAVPVIGQLADVAKPLGVSPALFVYVSGFLTAITIIGRMGQAAVVAAKGVASSKQ